MAMNGGGGATSHSRFSRDDADVGTVGRGSMRSARASVVAGTADAARRMSVTAQGAADGRSSMFIGSTAEEMRRAVLEGSDVTELYHKHGISQSLARSEVFTTITLAVISINTLWIGIELDINDVDNLFDAAWYVQLIELSFFTFFASEWTIRFLAFSSKRNCFKDRWFCFDSILVVIMIIDTIVLPLALQPEPGEENNNAGMSQLSLLRMGRLLRLTRMVRFIRTVPELVSLVKGVRIAARPVFWTMVLIFLLLYMFAIIFRSQYVPKDPYLRDRFDDMSSIMWCLLLQGAFLDSVAKVADKLLDENVPMGLVFMVFVFACSQTLLNLLIGVLVDVMNTMAKTEKEKATTEITRAKLQSVLEDLDEDGSGTIDRREFEGLINHQSVVEALNSLGVDPQYLLSLSDHIFNPMAMGSAATFQKKGPGGHHDGSAKTSQIGINVAEVLSNRNDLAEEFDSEDREKPEGGPAAADQEDDEKEEAEVDNSMTFNDFINTVIRLRSVNRASVVDIVDLRKLIMRLQQETEQKLEALVGVNQKLQRSLLDVHHHPFMKIIGSHPDMRLMGSVRRGKTSEASLPRGSAQCILTRSPRQRRAKSSSPQPLDDQASDAEHDHAGLLEIDQVYGGGLAQCRPTCCSTVVNDEVWMPLPTHPAFGMPLETSVPRTDGTMAVPRQVSADDDAASLPSSESCCSSAAAAQVPVEVQEVHRAREDKDGRVVFGDDDDDQKSI